MSLRLYDSHNHFQDAGLDAYRDGMPSLWHTALQRMVVNGTQESDWSAVLKLAKQDTRVIPTFGLHPWYVTKRSDHWQKELVKFVDQIPSGIGEIGLDRWIEGFDLPQQEDVFLWQLRVAAERNLPVSIHCLKAWGRLLELLENEPRPACGFLLHSYGGPLEMIESFVKLGGYFSISGYFAHERKARQQEVFRHVPSDRLLIETDAPDMLPPEEYVEFPLKRESAEKPLNNPANIGAVYRFVAKLLNKPIELLAKQTEENFLRLYGGLIR